jgi:hypothetical protein
MLSLGHKIPQIDKAVRERQINLTMDRKALVEVAYPMFRMRDQNVVAASMKPWMRPDGRPCKHSGAKRGLLIFLSSVAKKK